ncbi:hypothetical protein [Neisseria dumasiana]|uniref:Uncharacterized protein n=1 Tax=Neisseria dumasiana TaxID=1931275 RepID=A0A1X3DIV8_9NEIS|nr:hypothetical protein [Neisseria dumasiana]OSI22019.1 hypothetical protein BV912_05690 [Neisseria dumasiana]
MDTINLKDVFGVSPEINLESYVDRGGLDKEIGYYLEHENKHIALKGESKCGKSWLIKKNIKNPLVIQCRLKTTIDDIYTEILAQLGIKLIIEEKKTTSLIGRVEANSEFGINLIGKVRAVLSGGVSKTTEIKTEPVGEDINNLKFIAELIKQSGRKIVIEDFHYLSIEQRKIFSFDLKTLWDFSCFVVVVGVWTQSNLLLYLNPDLAVRVQEISIYWDDSDLLSVLEKGSQALNIVLGDEVKNQIISDCYQNVGLLQTLVQTYLKEEKIFYKQEINKEVNDSEKLKKACQDFAKQLDARYMRFATDVSKGIRNRENSTGIYPYAMSIILNQEDEKLIHGVGIDIIYQIAHARQPRIQKVNLKTILGKLEELQVDEEGRGLVLAFNKGTDEVSAIDRTILFYRKYFSAQWPWEELIAEIENKEKADANLDLFS